MWDGFNNRKFPRVQVQCDIRLHPDTGTAPIATVTQNVGIGGVCVLLEKEIERFAECQVRLNLDSEKNKVECKGRVVWKVGTKEPKDKRSHYDIGIEFVDLEEEKREKIRQFLQEKVK